MHGSAETEATAAAFRQVRRHLLAIGLVSAAANLLLLTGPLYMLQVYDRVLASGSVPTLVVISAVVLVAFAFLGLFDWIRLRMMARVAAIIQTRLFGLAFPKSLERSRLGLAASGEPDPVDDLDHVHQYLSTNGPMFVFDLPWLPVFLLLVYVLHPVLGLAATVGAAVLVALTLVNQAVMRRKAAEAGGEANTRRALVRSAQINGEAVIALGMGGALQARLEEFGASARKGMFALSDSTALFSTVTKVFRLALQSALLGTGAVLAIAGEVSPGSMIVASTIAARALSPVEQAVGGWRQFVSFRDAWARLTASLGPEIPNVPQIVLPSPSQVLTVTDLTLLSADRKPVLNRVDFELTAGQALGVIGPSGAGKTSLARALTGLWPATHGTIELDGARLDQWSPDQLGTHIGYLPQRVDMVLGTIAENISRFSLGAKSEDIIAAAKAANVHDLIVSLPKGYETQVGGSENNLSAGQQQRIGLARAVYGSPFLVVLDEPNSALDGEGEEALRKAIETLRAEGSIVIVMSHRSAVIHSTDVVLVLNGGEPQALGTRDEILKRVTAPTKSLEAA